jgi:hypothetical protein
MWRQYLGCASVIIVHGRAKNLPIPVRRPAERGLIHRAEGRL